MKVNFYQFAKKLNSTKLPTVATPKLAMEGQLKEGSSVINADITINIGSTSNPSSYNYCYIEEYNRYYFIDEWTYSEGLWTASLSVDVLASYKSAIGNKTLYVLRSAEESDEDIIDTFYPTTTDATIDVEVSGQVEDLINTPLKYANYWTSILSQGVYVIGIVGNNETGASYYEFTPNNFKTLITNLFQFTPSDMSDVSNGIAKQLANPMQYITSVQWYSVSLANEQSSSHSLKFGNYTITADCRDIDHNVAKYKTTINVPKHPQASTRGNYLNSGRFSQYALFFNAFGTVELDPLKIMNCDEVLLYWDVDITSGKSLLFIKDEDGNRIGSLEGKISVDIPLTQINVDTLGAISSVASSAGSALGSLLKGNVLGTASSIVNGAIGYAQANAPTATTKGTFNSLLNYEEGYPMIVATFTPIVDEDLDHAGRPLCQNKQINTLSGYIQCRDGDVDIACTETELSAISSYLTEGFFYE